MCKHRALFLVWMRNNICWLKITFVWKKLSLNHSGLQDDLRNIMKLTMDTFLKGSISSSFCLSSHLSIWWVSFILERHGWFALWESIQEWVWYIWTHSVLTLILVYTYVYHVCMCVHTFVNINVKVILGIFFKDNF